MADEMSYKAIMEMVKEKADEEVDYLKKKFEDFKENDFVDEKELNDSRLFSKVVRITGEIVKNDDTHKKIKSCKGIYIFRLINKIKVNYFDFNKTSYGSPLKYKHMKLKSIPAKACLYVGKSDNFYSRMKTHFGNPEGTTGGLRITDFYRTKLKDNVVCYCFVMKPSLKPLYEILARTIERKLNDKLDSYIGNK